ncbi:hypothetical protein V8B97DRAFT_1914054 [Scleroderma yunnanense]
MDIGSSFASEEWMTFRIDYMKSGRMKGGPMRDETGEIDTMSADAMDHGGRHGTFWSRTEQTSMRKKGNKKMKTTVMEDDRKSSVEGDFVLNCARQAMLLNPANAKRRNSRFNVTLLYIRKQSAVPREIFLGQLLHFFLPFDYSLCGIGLIRWRGAKAEARTCEDRTGVSMMQRGYEAVMINSRRSPWSSEKTPKKCLGVVLAVVDVTAQPERRKEKHRAEQVVDVSSVLPWKFGGLLPLLGFLGEYIILCNHFTTYWTTSCKDLETKFPFRV